MLATVPAGDALSEEVLVRALSASVERAEGSPDGSSLERLQMFLFEERALPRAELGEDVQVLSAPGESRECVEIARALRDEAELGTPFDEMAVLLRAPGSYRAHLAEALRRAGIPAVYYGCDYASAHSDREWTTVQEVARVASAFALASAAFLSGDAVDAPPLASA